MRTIRGLGFAALALGAGLAAAQQPRAPVAGGTAAMPAARTPAAPAAPEAAAPADRADLERTQITGNRELPKVLYIVPWKKPVPGEMSGRPVASVLDEALAPVDRDVFRRQVQYDAQLAPVSPSSRSAAPAAPAR
jgi:hypothetical protein